ncbi:MAG TPA: hypothetical protein VN203_19570 [Candidatus Acidoferrum sp.]|nr:hypothetical protein [Candidatus Acidoferrum sp.]
MEFLLQLAFVLACLFYGARKGGMALGLLGGIGPGLVATLTIDYFFLPPKYNLRCNPAEPSDLLVFEERFRALAASSLEGAGRS